MNVGTSPIDLSAGWNIISYLPQSAESVTVALASIDPTPTSEIVIVKNNAGKIYWPDYNSNSIDSMWPGQGYQICMKQVAELTYPAGAAKRMMRTARKTIQLPLAKHYALSKNTGNNASILATDVLEDNVPVADGSEVGAYDGQGNLVGSGVVMKGITAFSVWGKDPQTKVKDGLKEGEAISLKLWDGSKEYPLDMAGKKLAYSEDAILLGKLSVPTMYFIKKFALHGACSGLNGLVRIMFDVPNVDGKDLHNVTINLFDVSGRLVHQIASGQYRAGHYTVVWNGSTTGTGMYIVQMKAESFDSKERLMMIK